MGNEMTNRMKKASKMLNECSNIAQKIRSSYDLDGSTSTNYNDYCADPLQGYASIRSVGTKYQNPLERSLLIDLGRGLKISSTFRSYGDDPDEFDENLGDKYDEYIAVRLNSGKCVLNGKILRRRVSSSYGPKMNKDFSLTSYLPGPWSKKVNKFHRSLENLDSTAETTYKLKILKR